MASLNVKNFHGLELLHYCGGGAFGDVYYCRDLSGRELAVKIVSKQKLGDAWKRELKGVINYGRITEKAPELLQIFHAEDDAECFYYTMEAADSVNKTEYIPDTLAGRLAKGPLPQEKLYEVLYGIFTGIKTIHDARFAHRDIKPENIVFVKGVPKLGDIGLISSFSATVTQLAGTMDFIPPEQRIGDLESSKELRQKSDLYAFGKVVYCAVTGRNAADFPSLPNTFTYSSAAKYFLRLSYRLCDRETSRRIEKLSDLELELKEIRRKLTHGETWKDELKYRFVSIGLFWKGCFYHLLASAKKHPLTTGILTFISLTGGFWGIKYLNSLPDQAVIRIAEVIQQLKNRDNLNPADLKTYHFLNGRYSISLPKDWIYHPKEWMIRQRIARLYGKQQPRGEPGNTQYRFRNSIGFFFPRSPSPTEKINTLVTVARLPLTETEFAKIPDSGLEATLRPYLGNVRNLTLKRFNNPRNGYLTIFANGHLPSGTGYMAYLYPAKDHTLAFSIALADKYAQQDQSVFWQAMDTFERKNDLEKITECASLGTPAELEKLLAKDTNVEAKDSDGRSLLMIAVCAQNYENAKVLLRKGANINASAYNHSTALMIAVDDGKTESVRFLLKHGAIPDLKDDHGNTALVHAVFQKKAEILRMLIRAGANVNIRTVPNMPILFEAVIQPNPEILKILLPASGLELNQCDDTGRNALISLLYWRLLTHSQDNGCAKLLVEHGISVNHADKEGNTALMFAAGLNDKALAEHLLRYGANKSIRNKKGHIALEYCRDVELKKILQ